MIKTLFECDICKKQFTIGSDSISRICVKEFNDRVETTLHEISLKDVTTHICKDCYLGLKNTIWPK